MPRPDREFIGASVQLVGDLLDTLHLPRAVLLAQSIPETGATIEAVVKAFCPNEDVRVEEIAGHPMIPTSRARLLNVSVLETPSIR